MRTLMIAVSCLVMVLAPLRLFGDGAEDKAPPVQRAIDIAFSPPETISPLAVTRTAVARLLSEPPVLDGRLDDACWQDATKLVALSCLETVAPAASETEVWVGHYEDCLFLAVRCSEEDPERRTPGRIPERDQFIWYDDNIQILLDSRHDRGDPHVIVVSPAGSIADYTVAGPEKNLDWNIPCLAAGAPTETGWAVEVVIPRSGLDNPQNDIIGFNVVRRRPDMEGEPFSWNPAPRNYEQGSAMGNLIFETHPCTIQKVEVGRPHVGLNRIRIRLRNHTDQGLRLRAGLVSRCGAGRIDQSKYRLTLPAGKSVIYGLDHHFSHAGLCELAGVITDETGKKTISRFSRPELEVAYSALVLEPVGVKEGRVQIGFAILLPKRELKDLTMMTTLREEGAFPLLEKEITRRLTSRRGVISVPIEQADPKQYRLLVHLTRRDKTVAVAGAQIPAPSTEEP